MIFYWSRRVPFHIEVAETSEDMLEWKITLEQALAQAPSVALVMGHNGIYPRKKAVLDFTNQSSAISSVIYMDGTLLNSKNQISSTTVNALREATSRGVKIVIATGKAHPAVIDIFKMVDLTRKDGIASEFSPGVFLQTLLKKSHFMTRILHRSYQTRRSRSCRALQLLFKVSLLMFEISSLVLKK
ncbi:Endoribonuclease YBEY, chloroplastic [Glycine soja]